MIEIVSFILEGTGYRVLQAPDGMAALSILQESHPHVILSDVVMPWMDGFTFYKQVRADSRQGRTMLEGKRRWT